MVGLWPNALFDFLHMPRPQPAALFQCVGMMVGVYAYGYWLVARDPARYGAFAYLGLAGKILGPVGFLFAANSGELPWSFGWINVANDLIWLPAFSGFAIQYYKLDRKPKL